MSWALQPDHTYLHSGTGADVFIAPDGLPQPGAMWLRFADKTANLKGVVCADAGGFNRIEAGVEGANVIVRTVVNGTPSTSLVSVAHGLASSTPVTMRVDVEGASILKVFFNGVLPAAVTVDLNADPVAASMLSRSGYGFTSSVNNALVLEAYKAPLIPNVLPALKVLVWCVNGDIWYATREPTTGVIRAALAKSRALASGQPISTAEFQQKLYMCDGVGSHKVFDAASLSVSDWQRGGITDPFYVIVAHQARVFGVVTTDKQNLFGSAVNDPTDYNTGVQLAGAAYGLSESNMPKIGEPIRALFPTTSTELIVFCARSVWMNSGDPALSGFSVTPVAFGLGGSGLRGAVMTTDGQVACHTTDGLCIIAGGKALRISATVLTELIQVNRPLDDYTVTVVRDTTLHGLLIFLTPVVSGPAVHLWYDERTGMYSAPNGGFWPESYPDNIGPTAACDWDGTIVLGGRDGCLRTYDPTHANFDGVAIAWRLPLLLAAPTDLEHDAIIRECSITRADGASEFDAVFYGGRSAEEAAVGDARTLLIRKRTYGRTSKFTPNVRSAAIVLELSGTVYNTVGALEAVQIVTTTGALSRFARTAATDTSFGNSLRRGSTQFIGGNQVSGGYGSASGAGPGTGTGTGTGGGSGGTGLGGVGPGTGTGTTSGTTSGTSGSPASPPPYPGNPAGAVSSSDTPADDRVPVVGSFPSSTTTPTMSISAFAAGPS